MKASLLAACLLLATSAMLPAQSPAERGMLAAWDDTLDRVSDPLALQRLDSLAGRGGGSAGELRRLLFQARSSLLKSDRTALELVLSNLNWMSLTRKSWPWPEYAMAKLYAEMERRRMPALASGGQKDGESHVEAAWRHLQECFHDDSSFAPVRRFATALLVAQGDRELRGDERMVLRRLAAREHPEPDVLLVLGRQLRAARQYDSALTVFRAAVASGGDASRLAIEVARTLTALGRPHEASAEYWSGTAALTDAGREAYRYDLAWIMDPDSLPLFDKVPLQQLPRWLHRFWDERDAAAANHPGERLQEHLRRWVYAFEHYRVFLPWRHNQFSRIDYVIEGMDPCVANDSAFYRILAREQPRYASDIRGREPLLDNRGLIYLHHGPPFRTTNGLGPAMDVQAKSLGEELGKRAPDQPGGEEPFGSRADGIGCPPPPDPNESWLYWMDGKWRLLHFRPSCALGRNAPSTLVSYLPASFDYYIAMAALLPEYAAAARRMQLWELGRHVQPLTCLQEVTEIIAVSRADAAEAVHTDTDTPPIIRPWNSVVQMFALGHGAQGNGKALLSFALSGGNLHPDTTAGGPFAYPVTFRIVAFDHASGQSITLDTVRRFVRQQPLQRGQSLAVWFELPLGSGTWQVAVRANQGDDSSGVYAMKKDLRVDGASEFALSDIVMGREGAVIWPATDGQPFPLNSLGAYPAGGVAEVYYEVHGLSAGDLYQTTVVVREQGARGKEGIRIVGTDRAGGLVTPVRKALELKLLKPGSYRLIVTVESKGRRATREQPLLIAKP